MNCEEVIGLYLLHQENAEQPGMTVLEREKNSDRLTSERIEKHLSTCADCRRKIAEINHLMVLIESSPEVPVPATLDQNFKIFLKEQAPDPVHGAIVRTLSKQLWIAAGLILLVGLSILFVLINQQKGLHQSPGIVQLPDTNRNMFTSSSPAVRLQAITQVDSTSQDQQLLNTLSDVLLRDKNSNVRMAALYSLAAHLEDPAIYGVFIEALKTEKEPVIQVLLINTISLRKHPASREAIQSLLNNAATRNEVRVFAEQTIKTL